MGITATLLKTSEVEKSVYLDSDKNASAIHAPGVATGATEVVAQKVTDITSLCCTVYSLAVDGKARSQLYDQFVEIKHQVGEDPAKFVPILGEVFLSVATGNSGQDWRTTVDATADSGKRSHLATRGTGNAIATVIAGTAIIKDLPEIAEKLSEKIRKVKSLGKSLEELAEAFAKKIDGLNLENVGNALDKLDDAAKKKLLNDIENFTDNDLLELEDNIGLLDEYKNISKLDDLEKGKKLPDWLQKIKDGQKFNKEREVFYPNNEVYLIKPEGVAGKGKYVILDSYIDGKEIVSRKFTQFDAIEESTGLQLQYLKELKDKYPPKTKIAQVESNINGANKGLKNIKAIDGQMILEIPVQTSGKIPQRIIEFAKENDIWIRDTAGKKY